MIAGIFWKTELQPSNPGLASNYAGCTEFSFSFAVNVINMSTNWRWLSYLVCLKISCVEVEVKPQKISGTKLSFCFLVLTYWDFMKLISLSFSHMYLVMEIGFHKIGWYRRKNICFTVKCKVLYKVWMLLYFNLKWVN